MSEQPIGHLALVNVGRPRQVRWHDRTVATSIWKTIDQRTCQCRRRQLRRRRSIRSTGPQGANQVDLRVRRR
jgi:hypothetical protein